MLYANDTQMYHSINGRACFTDLFCMELLFGWIIVKEIFVLVDAEP